MNGVRRELQSKYGAPVVIVNLVKRQERAHTHEHLLHTQFYAALAYLNQFLADEQAVQYIAFDVARCHKLQLSALPRLEQIGYNCVLRHGWFQVRTTAPRLFVTGLSVVSTVARASSATERAHAHTAHASITSDNARTKWIGADELCRLYIAHVGVAISARAGIV